MELVEKKLFLSPKKVTSITLDALRSVSGPIFQPVWPLLAIYTVNIELWGKAVDVWFFASLASIILSWGSNQYLQKRFSSFPNKIYDSFVESFYSRMPLLLIFLIFLAFSPYDPIICISYILLFMGKYINQSFETLYIYEKNDWKPIFANIVGLGIGVAYYFWRLPDMSLIYLIFAIGLSEISKSAIHLILNYKVFVKGKVERINLEMYLITYNFFIYSFSIILILTIDRFFIYTKFEEADKALYQIFMNFMVFVISLPNFITQFYHNRDRRSKIRVDNSLRMKVLLLGLLVNTAAIYISYIICIHVFMLQITPAFLAAGLLFAFPSTLYTPLVIYFYNKNNHGLLSRCAAGAAVTMLTACGFFIKSFGLIGGIYCCILGQWIFMFLVTILYEQDQISKKIKLIK
jgi:hypothetical protein